MTDRPPQNYFHRSALERAKARGFGGVNLDASESIYNSEIDGFGVYLATDMLGWFPDEHEAQRFKLDWLKVNQGVDPDKIVIAAAPSPFLQKYDYENEGLGGT